MTMDLFEPDGSAQRESLGPGAFVLRRGALPDEAALLSAVHELLARAPLRHMVTPGGRPMSVATSNCGALGWVSDLAGYRYVDRDPRSGLAWPSLPASWLRLAGRAAAEAGFEGFIPDACLINRYEPGARLSLHQDRDERDHTAPIVSVSLGLPAVFLFGGLARTDRATRVPLAHGDIVVWGGPARLRYHGVLPLQPGHHPLLGNYRINLTLRRAG
ncbi:DNA oxidative demethylase AlkB [Variovorax terrae]|uniref:DNA oxidative demethylase AlkB n=1 Tax=Variovorax terrae TaxID=2923278 RepID=A0A9X1VXU7_9BURK|nr:DNA oxidative demethylase AlkB [Variovorax terrae]MCJ0764925.1 DNA oxidative demethylase AlkB [Variovorax terrae]